MKDAVLKLHDISKSFFGVSAVEKISLDLYHGETLGLIGENGAGKSTLMNIIGGIIQPNEGFMEIEGKNYGHKNPADATKSGIILVHQELNLFNNLSIEENIFIDSFPRLLKMPLIDKRAIRKKTKLLLDTIGLHVSTDMLVERLSPGEKQLVEIAKVLSTDPKIIIFDEPTTSLTERETKFLFTLIKNLSKSGKSIIYISHILEDIMELSDRILVLRDGRLVDSDSKSKYSISRMIMSMVGRDIKQLFPERSTIPIPERALEAKGITQKGIVKDISFSIDKGEVLGLFGLMGSGRTELARILFGLDSYESGQILIKGIPVSKISPNKSIQRGIAFITEDRRDEGLLMDAPVSDNIDLVALPKFVSRLLKFINNTRVAVAVNKVVDSLQIKAGSIRKSIPKSLSGGNQQKVAIGKWLITSPLVFIMDEPTRGIDVGAKYEVHNIINQLAAGGSAILIISSEIEELIGICDRIIIMSRGEIVGHFTLDEFKREKIMAAAFRQDFSSSILE